MKIDGARIGRRAVAGLLFAYHRFVSPALPQACRFFPTCSEYGALAIERHGIVRGAALALRRILRCHPFKPGGYDPVR